MKKINAFQVFIFLVFAAAFCLGIAGCSSSSDGDFESRHEPSGNLDDDDDSSAGSGQTDDGGWNDPTGNGDDDAPDDDDSADDDDDDATPPLGTTGNFDLTQAGGFYSLPFPIDLRLNEDGTIHVLDFPNPRNSEIFKRYLEVGERDVKGFGANSGIFFSFTGKLKEKTLPSDLTESMGQNSTIYFVSIDPLSPDYGERYPFRAKFTAKKTVYGPENLLVLLPYQGVPAMHGRAYAAVVTTRVKDSKGDFLSPNPVLQQVLAGASGDAEAEAVFAPLADYLNDQSLDFSTVAVATVFTTQNPMDRMRAMRDHAYSYDLPGIDPSQVSLEDEKDNYYFLKGKVTIPIYQQGQIPYVVTGGAIFFDDQGVPIVQADSEIRLAITIPKGAMPEAGWPILLFSHGSGGSWTSFIGKGTADWLAKKGIAAASIDAPHHGERNPISDDSTFESFCFYNALNPESFRDNNVQAAAELMAVQRQLLELSIPAEVLTPPEEGKTTQPPITFDADHVFFMGHSQGSTVGPLMVAVDPHVKAAYFSGAGASLLWNMLTKQEPFPTYPLVQVALHMTAQEAKEELDEFSPALSLIQHMAEMADPVSFNPYFFDREYPGVEPKDVFQAHGVADTYVGLPCHGAFAAAARMDLVKPLYDDDLWNRIYMTGGIQLEDTGVSGNRLDYDGLPVTAAVVQYPLHESGEDGHYVTFQYPSLHRRVACFFHSFLVDGMATVVDLNEDEDAACYPE